MDDDIDMENIGIEENDVQSFNLDEFNQRALELYEADNHGDFIRFIVNGKLGNTQVVVDPIQHTLAANQQISQLRDYDSLIGLSRNIEVERSIFIYPLPNPRDTLTESLHLQYEIRNEANGGIPVPIHKIPNIMFAKWDDRNMIRIVFPKLWSVDRRSSQLTAEEKASFYEKGLRPAVEALYPRFAWQWPPTYDDEIARSRLRNGQLSYSQKQWPQWLVQPLGEEIRNRLRGNGVLWAQDLLYLHNIRGTKVGTGHSLDENAAENALHEFMEEISLPFEVTERGSWFIDVGISIEANGNEGEEPCLQWRTDAHAHIVSASLGIPFDIAAQITTVDHSRYSRDLSSHLTSVSGFRLEPSSRAQGRWGAVYLQTYTMEKELTYNPQGHFHGMALTCQQAMTINNPFCDNLYNIYTNAIAKCSSRARIEVRVPFEHARSALVLFGESEDEEDSLALWDRTLRDSLLSIPRVSWWGLRAYRLLAFHQLLVMQREGPGNHRVHSKTLCLTAMLVMAINSLHSSMLEGSAMRSLLDRSLPTLLREEIQDPNILAYPTTWGRPDAQSPTVPVIQHGLMFLRDFRLPPESTPHFLGDRDFRLSPEAMQFFFQTDLEGLRAKYDGIDIIVRRVEIPPERVSTRTRMTTMYYPDEAYEEGEDERREVVHIFDLGREGLTLPAPIGNDGDSDFGGEEDEQGQWRDLDTVMDNIWRQFFVDLLLKCPNPWGKPEESYCKLTKEERLMVQERDYANRNLSDFFHKCQYRVGSQEQWRAAFDRLWPERGKGVQESVQGYRQCIYWNKWRRLLKKLDEATAKKVRTKVWRRFFKELFWVPSATQDKIWPSKRAYPYLMLPPDSPPGPAPHVLVKARPGWNDA